MKQMIFERAAKSGAKIEVFVESGEGRNPVAVAYVGGKIEASVCSLGDYRNPKLPDGFVSNIGRVAITAEEKASIEAWLKAANEWYRASTTSGLREQRQILSDRLAGAREEAAAIRTRNFHANDTGDGMGKNDWDAKASLALGALRAFDAAHPEIISGIESEKAEAARRFSESN